ncbi:TPA: hypothetical protein ACGO9L_001429 [Streptococcus suis]
MVFLFSAMCCQSVPSFLSDERFFIVEAWVENGRATIYFITPKTFEQTELVLDYFVAQWPWQPVEELGGN